jgi:hypothetical protein
MGGRERQSLVAVDQRVVAGKGVNQGAGLLVHRRVGVLPERGRLRTRCCSVEETDVSDLDLTEDALRDVQQVLEVEVDHSPRRRRASAYRGRSSSRTWSSSSPRLVRSM